MRDARSRRGGALILVLILVVIMAGIAESVVRVSLSRSLAYRAARDRLRAGLAARSALAELNECLGPTLPEKSTCAGWSAWSCTSGRCTASRSMAMGSDVFAVSAVWTPASERLEVSVNPP